MPRKTFGTSVALVALITAMGGTAMAQNSQPAAPTPAESAASLPEMIRQLNLTDLETRQSPRGTKVGGDLPGGGEIEIYLDPEGKPVMVDVDDAEIPAALREALLPETIRGNDILGQFSKIEKLGTRNGFVMVGGEDAEGEDLRAGFDPDGRLMRFGRGDDDRKRGPRGMDDHSRHHRDGDRMGHGPRHGMGDWKGHGEDHGHPGEGRFMGHGGPGDGHSVPRGAMMPPPSINGAEVAKTLEGAGYSQIEAPRPAGPRMLLDAVNPAGEKVTIEVDPAGEVVREQAR